MDNHLHWINSANNILMLTIPQIWTWDEMTSWLANISAELDTCHNPVAVILDFQYSAHVPQNAVLSALLILENLHKLANPNILTGLSAEHKSVLDTLFRLHPQNCRRLVLVDNIQQIITAH